jgi:hypothetical protein
MIHCRNSYSLVPGITGRLSIASSRSNRIAGIVDCESECRMLNGPGTEDLSRSGVGVAGWWVQNRSNISTVMQNKPAFSGRAVESA